MSVVINEERPILILGAGGNLGSQLVIEMTKKYGKSVVPWTRKECDVLNFGEVECGILRINPSVVINAVAYNGVDACEHNIEEQEVAIKINVLFVEHLARVCSEIGAKLIHFSTNYVFSGNANEYLENAECGPVNFYGLTKKMGEDAIVRRLTGGLNGCIVRVSNLFGPKGNSRGTKPSFFDSILKASGDSEKIQVIDDEISCFTYTIDVAKNLVRYIDEPDFIGIYHFVNSNPLSWYEAAEMYFKLINNPVTIQPVSGERFAREAKRPRTAILKSTRVAPMRGIEEAITEYVDKFCK